MPTGYNSGEDIRLFKWRPLLLQRTGWQLELVKVPVNDPTYHSETVAGGAAITVATIEAVRGWGATTVANDAAAATTAAFIPAARRGFADVDCRGVTHIRRCGSRVAAKLKTVARVRADSTIWVRYPETKLHGVYFWAARSFRQAWSMQHGHC